jgi:hypothetical protein
MPNIALPLPNVAQSVTRPIIVDIIQQVSKLTNISEDSKIFYPGDIQRMQTSGSGIDNKDRSAIFNSDRYTFIEVDEDFDEDFIGTMSVDRNEHIPIFVDEALGIELKPVYGTTKITINFVYRSPSKSEVTRWRDEARVRVAQLRTINLHDVAYHYGIPEDVLGILKEIHTLREATDGYSQSYEDYVKSYSTERLVLMSDTVGKSAQLSVQERQCRIQGIYDFDALPEKASRDESTGTWSITFSYKFTYEKPIFCKFTYPVMVHNKLLPANLIEFTNKAYDLNDINKTFSKSFYAMNSFESDTTMNAIRDSKAVIRIPEFDDFPIQGVMPGTSTVILALIEVGADKRTLLNLNELGDVFIDPDILDFIKTSEYLYMTRNYASILTLSMYRNNSLTSDRAILCDSNLNVYSNTDLNLRHQHRIRFGINVDMTMLPPSAFVRLLQYPKALTKIIGAMNELLRNNYEFINLGNKKQITHRDFSNVYSFLTGFRMPNVPGNYYGPGIDHRNLFADIDPRIVENYRKNNIANNRVMVSEVAAMRRDV